MTAVTIDISSLLIATIPTVLGGVAVYIIQRFVKKSDRYRAQHEAEQIIQGIKIDSIIYGLSSINSGIGEKFKSAFDEKYNQLMQAQRIKDQ